MSDNSFDHCPTCGRRITDVDPEGCETINGQRYRLRHLLREVDPDLYDTWHGYVSGTGIT